jgi:hypothetical protein
MPKRQCGSRPGLALCRFGQVETGMGSFLQLQDFCSRVSTKLCRARRGCLGAWRENVNAAPVKDLAVGQVKAIPVLVLTRRCEPFGAGPRRDRWGGESEGIPRSCRMKAKKVLLAAFDETAPPLDRQHSANRPDRWRSLPSLPSYRDSLGGLRLPPKPLSTGPPEARTLRILIVDDH